MMAAGWRFERHKLVFLFPFFFFQIKVHTHASERTSVACVEMCVCGTYKAVSARLAGLAVGDHHRLVDVAKSLEVLAERRVVGVVRQPAHEDLGEGGVLLKRRRRRRVHDFQGSSVHELVQEHLARPGRKGRGRSGGEKEEAGDPLRDAWTRLRSPPVSGGGQKKNELCCLPIIETDPVISPLRDSSAAAARSRSPTGCFSQQTAASHRAGTIYTPPVESRPQDALDQSGHR